MSTWKKVVVESTSGNISQNTTGSAATLTDSRDFSLSGEVTASAQSFDGSGDVTLTTSLDKTAITGQGTKSSAVSGDILLIADSEDTNALKQITRANFISGLGAGTMSSFNIEVDSANGVQVDDGEVIDFLSGTGAQFVIGGSASAPTITVNSVDSAIVHDNLSGFVANEHINHSSVSITAGDGLTGGGDITATRSLSVQAADNTISVAAGGISVNESNLSDIPNSALANDSVTVGSTEIDLGATQTSIAGLTGLDFTAANASIAASIGGNTLTVGGSSSTVVIAGDLQVDGTTTTVNSTELTVDDINITVASGAADASSADGAGLTVDVDADTDYASNPQLQWNSTHEAFSQWKMVKGVTGESDAFIAGMVAASNTSALDALTPGIGTLGMVGSDLYIQTA